MGKTNFGLNVVAAILKFKLAAYTMIPNVIFTCFIRFLDHDGFSHRNQVSMIFQYWNIGKAKFGSNGVAAIFKCIL